MKRSVLIALLGLAGAGELSAQGAVSGRVVVLEKDGTTPPDLASAVVWLSGDSVTAPAPGRAQIVTEKREFRPRVLVIPVGARVTFPNLDPFNHNIFATQPTAFDLGLYGRGEGPTQRFTEPGLVRIFCNIHPRMSGFIQVVATAHWAQPGPDGRFGIGEVPAGRYALHAWHERAAAVVSRDVVVSPSGADGLTLELDARGYRVVQHLNKYGKPYGRTRERY